MRVRSIDIFRGLAVVLMVFFTTYAVLTPYQDLLQHNEPDSVHLGDFVLPMFLFASGMSLAFFAKKREKESRLAYTIDCLNRLTLLFLISLFLGPTVQGGRLPLLHGSLHPPFAARIPGHRSLAPIQKAHLRPRIPGKELYKVLGAYVRGNPNPA